MTLMLRSCSLLKYCYSGNMKSAMYPIQLAHEYCIGKMISSENKDLEAIPFIQPRSPFPRQISQIKDELSSKCIRPVVYKPLGFLVGVEGALGFLMPPECWNGCCCSGPLWGGP